MTLHVVERRSKRLPQSAILSCGEAAGEGDRRQAVEGAAPHSVPVAAPFRQLR
jgi:hypothetical protein